MSTNRRQKPTFLVCKHCGEVTTEAEYAQNGPLKAVSPKSGTLYQDTITNALKRLDMYPPRKERKKNDEKTLRTDSKDNRETDRPGARHDSTEGQPSFGPVHNL